MPIASINDRQTITAVSLMICANSWLRLLPSTFRMPTSRDRFTDKAVDRLIKFTQAIRIMNRPMSDNVSRVVLLVI